MKLQERGELACGLEIEKTAAVISTIVVATVNKTNNHF